MKSKVLLMLIILVDIKEIAYKQLIPMGQIIDSNFILKFCNNKLAMHHDKALSLTFLFTTDFLTKNIMMVNPHPPFLSNLAPCNFSLYPRLKIKLKGCWFDTVEMIQAETHAILDSFRTQLPGHI